MNKEQLNRHNQYTLTAACISSKDNLYKACLNIDYFDAPYRQIIEIMQDLDDSGMPVDMTTIANRISTIRNNLTVSDLIELNQAPMIFNFDEILIEIINYKNRQYITSKAADYKNGIIQIDELLNYIEALKSDLNKYEIFDEIGNYLHDPYSDIETLKYYPTRLQSLDNLIDGYFQGDLFIIAARPGIGKSSFALQSVIKNSFAFFSLEMPKKQLGHRLISMYTGIHIKKLRKNLLNESEKKQVHETTQNLKQICKIIPIDSKHDINEIVTTIKILHKRGKINGAVIDYLQLISGGPGQSENLRLGGITRKLKQLAITLNIPIILLSQLSRDSEKTNREPDLTDLRDSGSIEQDADAVLFLHINKDEKFNNVFSPEIKMILAKYRNGEIGFINNLIFNKTKYRIEEKEVDSFDSMNKMDYINN